MLPGWIASVKGYFISNKFIIPGKARAIDALIPVWIITEKEGSIISAHCVDSKASPGETFFHTASVLLFVRVDENSPKSEKLACTQVICPWILTCHYFVFKDDRVRSSA